MPERPVIYGKPIMKSLLAAVLLLSSLPLFAAPPTTASVEQLLEALDSGKMLEASLTQTEEIMQAAFLQAAKDQPPSAERDAALRQLRVRIVALLREEMSWTKMRPHFVRIYRDTFSQEEVDGMLKFYRSDVGRSVNAKMPLVMQNSAQLMQQLMVQLAPRLKAIQEEALAELKPK